MSCELTMYRRRFKIQILNFPCPSFHQTCCKLARRPWELSRIIQPLRLHFFLLCCLLRSFRHTEKTMQAQTLHLGRIGANALLRRRILGGNLRQQKSSTNNNLLGGYSRHAFCGRSFSSSSSSDLPYHIVMGLPALSPTMESGALAEWYVKEGDRFAAGDAVAKIETDKASIDFEAQDDGFVAKILATAGDGQDIAIGTPIMISVEEEEHVAAFANYISPTTTAASVAAPVAATPAVLAAPPAPPKAAATAPVAPPVAPPPVVAAATPPPPPAAAALAPLGAAAAVPTAASFMNIATAWGSTSIKSASSPLAKTLEANHLAYIEKYGTTGQSPSSL
jgi:Biotin-requiring enzyme